MTDQPNSKTNDPASEFANSATLRYMIREAVEREIENRLAPYRQDVQVTRGMATQLNKDYGALSLRVNDLEETMRGDVTKGIPGVLPTLGELQKTIKQIGGTLENFNRSVSLAKWLLGALVALGFFDTIGLVDYIKSLMSLPL